MVNIGEIVQTIKSLIETRISLIKQDIQDEFVGIISRLMLLLVIVLLLVLTILFLSLSLAYYLNQIMDSPYYGFLMVALMYLLVMVILIKSRDSLRIHKKGQSILKIFIFKTNRNSEDDE